MFINNNINDTNKNFDRKFVYKYRKVEKYKIGREKSSNCCE